MKKSVLIFLISLVLSIALSLLKMIPIDIYGITELAINSFIGFVAIGVWTVFCLKKYSDKIKIHKIVIAIFLGVSVLELSFRLIQIKYFWYMLDSLPELVIWNLGILAGYLFALFRTRILQLIGIIAFILIGYILCIPCCSFFKNKLNYGIYNDKVVERIKMPLLFKGPNNSDVDLSHLRGKYLVLYFWNDSNDISQDQFPEIQKLYSNIEKHNNILFYSVFCIDVNKKEISQDGYEMLRRMNYSFPTLSMFSNGYLAKSLGVESYPMLMLIDKRQHFIIYKGRIISIAEIMSNLKQN